MSEENYTSWDSAEFLTVDVVTVEYLRAALEENAPAFLMKAVGNVARDLRDRGDFRAGPPGVGVIG